MLCKMRSKRGATLTELLVALVLISILGMGVTGGTAAAGQVCGDTVAYSDSALLLNTITQVLINELRYARDISDSEGTVTYTSPLYGEGVSIIARDGQIYIKGSGLDEFNILGAGAYAGGTVSSTVSYDETTGPSPFFSVKLELTRANNTQEERTFQVYPIYT